MKRLRSSGCLRLSVLPLYAANPIAFKLCYLNTRSLHRHIDDICKDLNYSSTDISIFSETRFINSDHDNMYTIDGYNLFRNDSHLITLQDLLEVQLFTAESSSFLVILIVLIVMVLR